MKKVSEKVNTLLFAGFIGLFFAAIVGLPDREFSPLENRVLEQKPEFSIKALLAGELDQDTETWLADQFPLRDACVALKSGIDAAVGKKEFHGVYLTDERLLERIDPPKADILAANIAAVQKADAVIDVPVTLALAPTASEIYKDTLPYGAPGADQMQLLEEIYNQCGVPTVNLAQMLRAHRNEYIFYRTDHHWTSLGAYYGASALLKQMGMEIAPLTDYDPERVSETFQGTLYSSSGVRTVKPDAIDLYVPQGNAYVESWRDGTPKEGTLYDRSFLAKKDQYSMFLGGNQPLAVIRTGHAGGKLLLVRDSYADSIAPFLMEHFSEIHLFDARYFKQPLSSYVQKQDIDQVVMLFSLKNFLTDTSLPMVCK